MEMRRKFKVVVNGKEYTVEVEEIGDAQPSNAPVAVPQSISVPRDSTASQVSSSSPAPAVNVEGSVTAPMPGKILDVKVKVGDSVKSGDVLLILEAMKMENEIVAPKDGVVKEIRVTPGDSVNRGDVLAVIG